jgi:hypothetical protein
LFSGSLERQRSAATCGIDENVDAPKRFQRITGDALGRVVGIEVRLHKHRFVTAGGDNFCRELFEKIHAPRNRGDLNAFE